MNKIEMLKQHVINNIDLDRNIDNQELLEIIDKAIWENDDYKYVSIKDKLMIRKEMFDSIRGFDVLQEIIEDSEITEIMVNGKDNVFVEKNGKISKSDIRFDSEEKLQDIIQQMVSDVNRRVNEASPIVDTRLLDGSRVNIVLKPIAIDGPVITIRKFPKERLTMDKLIETGAITKEAAEELRQMVCSGFNIFISGGTSSGKTTFLNALSDYIPKSERIITIEDSAELQICGVDNLVRLEVRQANSEGTNEVTIRDLIKASLRMRPDRIVVGEVRGEEALYMLQAMNTGHDGSLSTGHANSTKDVLTRLETMVLMGVDMPISAVKGQIAAGIDVIVHLGKVKNKGRKVLEVTEVVDYFNGEIRLNPLYKYDYSLERLEKTGNTLINTEKLVNYKEDRENDI